MNYKTQKTAIIGALIVAMILPFSSMGVAKAQRVTAEELFVEGDRIYKQMQSVRAQISESPSNELEAEYNALQTRFNEIVRTLDIDLGYYTVTEKEADPQGYEEFKQSLDEEEIGDVKKCQTPMRLQNLP